MLTVYYVSVIIGLVYLYLFKNSTTNSNFIYNNF